MNDLTSRNSSREQIEVTVFKNVVVGSQYMHNELTIVSLIADVYLLV